MKLHPYKVIIYFFVAAITIGMLVISAPGMTVGNVSLLDKLFTVTSAVCVTGLNVINISSSYTILGQIVLLLLIQIGGLGYMLLGTFLIIFLGRIPLSQQNIVSESLNIGDVTSRKELSKVIKHILIFTLLFEATGTIILFIKFLSLNKSPLTSLFYGLFHSISAFCNAGFSLFSNNLEDFRSDIVINLVVSFLLIFGGLGFVVINNIYNHFKRNSQLILHTKIVLLITLFLIIISTILMYLLNINEFSSFNFKDRLLISWFQSITPRTAGFNTIDVRLLSEFSKILIIFLMFIGASPGGTGGGIKTTTFFVVFSYIYFFLRGQKNLAVFNRRIPIEIVIKGFIIVLLSITFIIAMTLAIRLSTGFSYRECLFEVVSAFGTVGLSLGITASLDNLGKILIIFTMLFGRVGGLTLLLALFSKEPKEIKYLTEEVAIG